MKIFAYREESTKKENKIKERVKIWERKSVKEGITIRDRNQMEEAENKPLPVWHEM